MENEELGFSLKGAVKSVKRKAGKVAKGTVKTVVGTKAQKMLSRQQSKVEKMVPDAKQASLLGKKIIQSPVTRVVAGGVALVFPPAGVPLAAAVETANLVLAKLDEADDARKAAQKAIDATVDLAKKGDKGAQRMADLLIKAKKERAARQAKAKNVSKGKASVKLAARVPAATQRKVTEALRPDTGNKPPKGSLPVPGLTGWHVTHEGLPWRASGAK